MTYHMTGYQCPICKQGTLRPAPTPLPAWDCNRKGCNNQFYFDDLGLNARDKYTGRRLWWYRNGGEVIFWLHIAIFTIGISALCIGLMYWITHP